MGIFHTPGIAWRNLLRNKRRTFITSFSIAFAVLLTVVMVGMSDGQWGDFIDTAAKLGGGHVTLQHSEYFDKPTLSRSVDGISVKAKVALESPYVDAVYPRITGQAMLSTAEDSFGAGFIAYDPTLEGVETISLLESITEGEMFTDPDERGVILGHRLARNLGVGLGDKVVFTVTDKHGEISSGLTRLKGVITTGARDLDGAICLLPIGLVRKTLDYGPDEATQGAVFMNAQHKVDDVAAMLNAAITDGSVALTWNEAQPDISTFVTMKKGGALFFEVLLLVLCAAGIFNTLFVSVMERLREFGVLRAIGMSPGRLFSLVMWESVWLFLCGGVFGVLLTAYPYYYLATTGLDYSSVLQGEDVVSVSGVTMGLILKAAITPGSLLAIALAAFAAVMASGLYPAYRASSVSPVDAIKLV